jgi:translocator protein
VKLEKRDVLSLAVAIVLPQAAGGLGAVATASSVSTWYKDLKKPSWNPPSWVFGPVWTVLYLMMGLAVWLVWRRSGEEAPEDRPLALPETPERRAALSLWSVQLVLNSLWSVIFFGLRSLGGAAAEIGVLWAAIAATAVRFYRIKPAAGLLLMPYLAWSTFASALNVTVWRMNRE